MTNVMLSCAKCGQKNRVPAARLGDQPRCGKCHEAGLPGSPTEVDAQTLEGLLREANVPVLVDFWAPWCGPCRTVAPVLQQVARDHAGQALVVKVNVDENPSASALHQVQGIPALVLFEGGLERNRLVGAHPRANIERLLQTRPRAQA